MSASKYPTNITAPGAPVGILDDPPHEDGDERDMTPTRINFYVPVTIRATEDFRIDVPAYLLERPEQELTEYIRENMDDAESRNTDYDDYDYDYSEITIS